LYNPQTGSVLSLAKKLFILPEFLFTAMIPDPCKMAIVQTLKHLYASQKIEIYHLYPPSHYLD
jgi:hypothetical protein